MTALNLGQAMVSRFSRRLVRSFELGLSLIAFGVTSQTANAQEVSSAFQPSRLLIMLPPLPALDSTLMQSATLNVSVIVKLGQRRVYLYRGDRLLATYMLAIGKHGWETPTGRFQVLSKEKNPVFKSFKTGQLIEPGPNNPLGDRWIGIWTDGKTQIGFHGTNQEELLGQAVSHGCLRMRNRDVTALFDQLSLGTTVVVEP